MSVIGSSLGGQIAAEFIINQNVDVKKLVLVSPSGVVAGVLGGIFLVSFFYNPESLFMVP